MKPRENLVHLKQFQVNEKKRQVAQLDAMIVEFDRMSHDLDAQIAAEERRTGITDIDHFAYSTFAKAARTRRDNLAVSNRDLKMQLESARALLAEAEAELAKAERLEERDGRHREPVREAPRRQVMIG